MNADDRDHSVYTFVRKNKNNRNHLLFIINMTPMKWEKFRVGVPKKGTYKVVLNSDEERFGGNGNSVPQSFVAEEVEEAGKQYSIGFDLPPYTALVLKY